MHLHLSDVFMCKFIYLQIDQNIAWKKDIIQNKINMGLLQTEKNYSEVTLVNGDKQTLEPPVKIMPFILSPNHVKTRIKANVTTAPAIIK